MKTTNINIITLVTIIFITLNFSSTSNAQILMQGNYLGQKLPKNVPVVFASGIISTEENELNSIFSCDGNEFYFSRGALGSGNKIFVSKRVNNVWSAPEVTSLTGGVDPHFSPDCKRIYFALAGDIVYAERMNNGTWSEIKNPEKNINSSSRELYPCVVADGSLYFQSTRPGGAGGSDIYRAQFKDGIFLPAVNIGAPINTQNGEGDVFVSPDERLIIFSGSGRSDSQGSGDLYISFRQSNGTWSVPENMGSSINSPSLEYCPMMSPDGKILYFTSKRNNNQGDIYWVSSKILKLYQE